MSKGISDEWRDRLIVQTGVAGMVAMYVRGIDFCMAHNWPDLETLREHFAGDPIVRDHGIFIDAKNVDVKNRATTVLLGASDAAISFDGHQSGEIYVRHDSNANLAVSGRAFVVVNVYDAATIQITATDHASILVKTHGSGRIIVDRGPDAVVRFNDQTV